MLTLQKNCTAVLTDSGGVQKEAYWFQRPCITLREETEWEELVKNGYNTLTGADPAAITEAFTLSQNRAFPSHINLYGDGKAAHFILKTIMENSSHDTTI